LAAQSRGYLQTRNSGKLNIHQDNLGPVHIGLMQGLVAACRLGNDLKANVLFQNPLQSVSKKRMIID